VAQTLPHWPQLPVSVARFLHIPPQQVSPPGQSPPLPQVQLPLTQLSPAGQACPHAPQLLVVFNEVSQPSAALALQSP
jgi:hypothetical protein